MKNTDFLRNRLHRSGYGVTFHTTGWMGESTYARKQEAFEAAQAHAIRASAFGSAVVFPRRARRMRFNGQLVQAVTYSIGSKSHDLQFITDL